jgi:ACS family pantothenate transporter-like MFS transporter
MNSLGYAFNAFVPLLTYPQVDSPRFRKGFIYTTVAFGAQAIITASVATMQRRDRKGLRDSAVSDGGLADGRDAATG